MPTSGLDRYVLGFGQIDATMVASVGGKAAGLGELSRMPGIRVPSGFCVTTDAFRRVASTIPPLGDLIERLALVEADDRDTLRLLSGRIREAFEAVVMPDDVAEAITGEILRIGSDRAYAVRSSATAEDLATASFAGQHDSYLNLVGGAAILEHVTRCWGSLFTERAVDYRLRNGVDQRSVQMAVVVQQMVVAQASGVLFTADPVTSNRTVMSVEATTGAGEALVSGLVNPDVYRVRAGRIETKSVAVKRTEVLTDEQVIQLAALGREIEAHFGRPQDIEWCLEGSAFEIVQSRPITTLFPVPERPDAENQVAENQVAENHVYVSVGHGQMMTDPMRPLGLSMWKLTAMPPMHVAGGRLFVDVTRRLASPGSRAALLAVFGRGDPLVRDALENVVDRGDFLPTLPDDAPVAPPPGGPPASIDTDPDIVTGLIARTRESIARLDREIRGRSGPALLEFILGDVTEMRRVLFDPLSQQAIMAGMEATWWLNDHMQEWLGEQNAADVLSRSAPHNVTSEMGLDLLDVADAIRPWPRVVEFLEGADDDGFLDDPALVEIEGGAEGRDAIRAYLDAYGMRCVGEIDITRPRWSEHPTALLPVILGHIRNFEPGEAHRRFELGRREAEAKEIELLSRLRRLPDGDDKAAEAKRMIDRVRTFIGYREFPKYGMINRYFIYKRALLEEADRLVAAQVLRHREDIFFLDFAELSDVIRSGRADATLVETRREAFASYWALTPPRVLTSDGEAISGSYGRRDLPSDALVGVGVSAGTVEGRARVIVDMAEADVEAGDILVTSHTDPSWSPLFVAIAGLVTEVGGLMTHGAVVAREYGLPAVVGVEHATRLIPDGRRIRVHGADGYVELL